MSYEPIEHYEYEGWERAAARFVDDLDRCEHGRHATDSCFGCTAGVSQGNPRMRGKDPRTRDGRAVLGYGISGREYVMLPLEEFKRGKPHVVLETF